MIRDRRVIHVGCTDAPFTEPKLTGGQLLHQRVLASASATLGVDVDGAGMALLSERLGGDYCLVDLASESPDVSKLTAFHPDVLLATDVIEHVGNAECFLHNLAVVAASNHAEIVISTPNALSARSFFVSALGLEFIHPDHVAIYSPQTLRSLAERVGLRAEDWRTYNITSGRTLPRRLFDLAEGLLSAARAGYADGLIVTFKPV